MNENLTPQIVAALLQDGTCKLTKAQMTTAVAAAVANLPKAYAFGGVAQPGLAPGSILAPTLFVAVAVGAYGSFSNQSVDVGQIAFFTSDDGGAWTRIEVYSATQAAIDAAVAAALEALGPVPKVIVSTADWALISSEGVTANTKAEAAQIAGITVDELDFLLNGGDLTPCLFVFGANGGSPSNYWYYTQGVQRGHTEESGNASFSMVNDDSPAVDLENGVYTIVGLGG